MSTDSQIRSLSHNKESGGLSESNRDVPRVCLYPEVNDSNRGIGVKRHALLGRIHTGSGSVPDSSEPNASGRIRVVFASTLQTTDPTRTVRVHFAVYTLRLLRDWL